jgi:tRNA(Ile2) C34 agmatinyltransferase TiaS
MPTTLTREQELAIEAYVREGLRIAEPYLDIIERVGPGMIGCRCGHVAPRAAFVERPANQRRGPRRSERLCPACGAAIEAKGYLDGDLLHQPRCEHCGRRLRPHEGKVCAACQRKVAAMLAEAKNGERG